MLGSITIFTNSTAIEPDGLAIIITLSLLLIILIISINYKQERAQRVGHCTSGREWGQPLSPCSSPGQMSPSLRPDLRDIGDPT